MRDEALNITHLSDPFATDGYSTAERADAPYVSTVRWDELDPDTACQILSSWQAAHNIAANYSLRFEDVRAEINRMSLNLWHLLDTPQGWAVLGEQIALILHGHSNGPLLRPAIH